MQETAAECDLYLTIDDITYDNCFRREGIALLVRSSQIKFFVVNIDKRANLPWPS
ncbi:MAG: element excision factor XisH family protein [Elainellaceae cyanobacterium]